MNIKLWEYIAAGYHDAAVLQHLKYGFPISYKGPIPDTVYQNHPSARQHACDIEAYVCKEVASGSYSAWPLKHPPFSHWCQINALLTRPKKDSEDHHIIMDLSWPHLPLHSVNVSTPTDLYRVSL